MDEKYIGVVEDPRSEEEKALDFKHEDLAQGEIVLNWEDYNTKKLKSFPIQNQDGSLSCVSQAVAKILAMHEVLEGRDYVQLCPKPIYDARENYPDGGMWLPNALSIGCSQGTCEEKLLPCDSQGEAFMNDKSLITPTILESAKQYRGKYYFEIKSRSIDEIAKILEQGYGVLLGFRFDYNEWIDVPFIDPNSKLQCGHGIAAVDYCLHNGVKALVIEDSWGPGYGKGGRRIITEEFLNARCFYAGYITSLPNFTFTQVLRMGSVGLEVRKLQEILNKKLGCNLLIDGKFGKKTLKQVQIFQLNNGLKIDGVVGPITAGKLLE